MMQLQRRIAGMPPRHAHAFVEQRLRQLQAGGQDHAAQLRVDAQRLRRRAHASASASGCGRSAAASLRRRARLTLKMPHSSMRCSSFSKPASATN